jgi:hypothetical protein
LQGLLGRIAGDVRGFTAQGVYQGRLK